MREAITWLVAIADNTALLPVVLYEMNWLVLPAVNPLNVTASALPAVIAVLVVMLETTVSGGIPFLMSIVTPVIPLAFLAAGTGISGVAASELMPTAAATPSRPQHRAR